MAARVPTHAGANSKWLAACEHLFDDKVSHALSWASVGGVPPCRVARGVCRDHVEGGTGGCGLTRSLCMIGRSEEALDSETGTREQPSIPTNKHVVLEAGQHPRRAGHDRANRPGRKHWSCSARCSRVASNWTGWSTKIPSIKCPCGHLLKVNRVAESQELASSSAAASQILHEDDWVMIWLEFGLLSDHLRRRRGYVGGPR